MTYIPHIITLVFCISILFLASINAVNTLRFMRRDMLQLMVLFALGWQAATIAFFIANQSVWVMQSHEELVGSTSAVMWIVYDYTNKLFHLSCGLIVYYYLGLRRETCRAGNADRDGDRRAYCPLVRTPELDAVKRKLDELNSKYCEAEKKV